MSEFCLPAVTAQKMKEAAREGKFKIAELYAMSSLERQNAFATVLDRESAKATNVAFEKALAKKTVPAQEKALKSWAESTFKGKAASTKLPGIMGKIKAMEEQGLMTPKDKKSFLTDLVASKLGATITPEEAKTITDKANHLQELHNKVPNTGDPTENPKEQIEYWKAKREMDDYLLSLNPASSLKVMTSTFGRGMMVASLHTPFLNVESHTIEGFLAGIERRIQMRSFHGLNTGFAFKYMKFANQVYDASAYDLSRFEVLGGERKSLGEEYLHSQGPGVFRAIGRLTENLVFKHLHGDLYQRFAGISFADSANLKTTAIAYAEGLKGSAAKARALEIFKDAVRIEPSTDVGKIVRAQAEADAAYATFTNKTLTSDVSMGLRKVVNTASGDFRLGDLTIPFAKIPANVLQAQLEYSGIFLPLDVITRTTKMLNSIHNGTPFNEASKEEFSGLFRTLIRAGIGFLFAYLVSTLIKPKDFIGAYPTTAKEQQLLAERNGVANSIRVGGHWISLDYLSVTGATLLGILYAKKYGGKTPLDYIYRYYQGATQPIQNLPGLNEIAQVYKYLSTPPSERADIASTTTGTVKSILGAIEQRIVPGLISDIAKMTDPYNRAVDKNSIFAQVQSNIPGLREGLPIKKDLFGDPSKTEPWISTLLFGSRVKNATDGTIINELVKLDQQGELPAITDVSRTSSRAKALKVQIGDVKFDEAMTYYGHELKQDFLDTMGTNDYQSSTPQDKAKVLNGVKEADFNDMLDTYGYEAPEKP